MQHLLEKIAKNDDFGDFRVFLTCITYDVTVTSYKVCSYFFSTNGLETLYIGEIGSPNQVHYVSIKILETPLLLVFLGEVDTYRGSDSAALRINFYKGPPYNIEKK